MLKIADQNLYAAKQNGRNQVVGSVEETDNTADSTKEPLTERAAS